jgi:hypothetical protein
LESEWFLHAACRGEQLEVFFPPSGVSFARALDICRACTVTEECLAAAVREEAEDHHLFDVRGGLTAPERRRDRARARAGS